jgi:hypothetical protein
MIKEKNEALINLTKQIAVLLFNRVYRWMWVSTPFSTSNTCQLEGMSQNNPFMT